MRVLVSGANGFIGRELCPRLEASGWTVTKLVRGAGGSPTNVHWSPESGIVEPEKLHGCDAVIHLAGEPLAGGLRWSAEKKDKIRMSRVEGTRKLVNALLQLSAPPRVFLCASAIGIYGNRGEETMTESSPPGTKGFLVEVAKQWEEATTPLAEHGIRVVNMRFGIVLGRNGGALAQMLPLFRLGLGGKLGSGSQWWSWIALEDVIRGILFVLGNDALVGPVNFTSPEPVRNRDFTATLARVVRRPAFFHVPAFVLRAMMGEMAEEMLLASTRVIPQRLLDRGFTFSYPECEQALRAAV